MRSDGAIDQAEGLRRLLVGGQTQIVTVVAGRGGMGRTTATLNLAAALVRSGKDVLVLDENQGPDNMLETLGLGGHYDLLDVALGSCAPQDVVLPVHGFGVLSAARAMQAIASVRKAARGVALGEGEWQRMEQALTEISLGVDVMLVDGAMLAGQAAVVSSSLSDGASLLVVVDATPTGITDSYALIKRLAIECSRLRFGIVVNRAVSEKVAMTAFDNMSEVARKKLSARLEYLGCIPQDEKLRYAMQEGRPVLDAFPAAAASRAYLELAQGLLRRPDRNEGQEGVSAIVQSLMNQACRPARGYGKEVAHVVN